MSRALPKARQPAGGGGTTRMNGVGLILTEPVAKDLELTDEQTAAIKKIGDEARKQMTELRDSLKDASQEERLKKLTDAGNEIAKKVDAVLNEKQRARVEEIRLQVRGPSALTDKPVADALKLSEEQTKKLAELVAARQAAVSAARAAANGDRDAAREKIGPIVKESAEKMADVLTSEQKEAFEKMKGQEDRSEARRDSVRRAVRDVALMVGPKMRSKPRWPSTRLRPS